MTFWIAASLLALAVGPLVHRLARRAALSLAALDGFVVVAVCGIALLHVLPEGVERAGLLALGAFAVGAGVPIALHRHAHTEGQPAVVVVAVVGVAVHAFLDGLVLGGSEAVTPLAVGVVLHRLAEGLVVWTLASSQFGARGALPLLGLLALATVLGAAVGGAAPVLPAGVVGTFEALVAGTLLHVITHRPNLPAEVDTWQGRVIAGIGGLLAVVLLVALHLLHAHGHGDLLALLGPAAAGWALGILLAATLRLRAWSPRSGPLGAAVTALLHVGAPARRPAGLPATTVLGPVALPLSFLLLGPPLAGIHLLAAVGIAAAAAATAPRGTGLPRTPRTRYAIGIEEAVHSSGPWLVAGAIGALIATEVLEIGERNVALALLIAGGIAFRHAVGALPVAAAVAPTSPPAALAVVLVGPVLAPVLRHGQKGLGTAAAAAPVALAAVAVAAAVVPEAGPVTLPGAAPIVAGGLAGAALASSLLGAGPRGFLDEVVVGRGEG